MKKLILILLFVIPVCIIAQVPILKLDTTFKAKAVETGMLLVKGEIYAPKLATTDTTMFSTHDAFGREILRKIAFPTANNWSVNGFSIYNNNPGNVCIGCTDPQGKFVISNNGFSGYEFGLDQGIGSGNALLIVHRNPTFYQDFTIYLNRYHLWSAEIGGEFFTAINGNVGIRNTNPTSTLTVTGNTSTSKLKVTDGAGLNKVLMDTTGNGDLAFRAIPGGGFDPIVSVGGIGTSPNAIGASLTNGGGFKQLNLEPADATNGGVINTSNQSLGAGDKYFSGKVGIGTTAPLEKCVINGAVTISNGGYTGVATDGDVAPVPAGGAGTIIFANGHFFGWNSSAWKRLDN